MTTDIVLHSTSEAFSLAEKIARSSLVPAAYRGKPTDAAIAMLYGAEMGFGPMTSLQRVVVIQGKPTVDAQGMVSLIRQAGHSLSGDVSAESATVTGKRCDTGDSMTITWTMDDARKADLLGKDNWKKFPADMLWARAVSQIGRRLFADVLLGVSYTPEEMADSVVGNGQAPKPDPEPPPPRTMRPPPGTPQADSETGEVVDAEVVAEGEETFREGGSSDTLPSSPDALTARELADELRALGLDFTGTKAAMKDRLAEAWSAGESVPASASDEPF